MMHVVWVTPLLPCLRSGSQVRQYHLIKYLAERHLVTVISLVRPEEVEEIHVLEQLGVRLVSVPFTPPAPLGKWKNRLRTWGLLFLDPKPLYAHVFPLKGLRDALRQVLAQDRVDMINFEHLFVAPLSSDIEHLPWVITEIDVEYVKRLRQSVRQQSLSRRVSGWVDVQKLYHWERAWVQRSSTCVAMSEGDANLIREFAPQTPIMVVANGVDVVAFAPSKTPEQGRNGLIFTGNLGYPPNVDSLEYFCQDILPLIRAKRPKIEVTIIGPYATTQVQEIGQLPGMIYQGFVGDVRPYLWQASVCIVPLRIGSGTRLKILEAMASECPVVSTRIGAEGLEVSSGEHLLIADRPEEFAHAVLNLVTDADRAKTIAERARNMVSEKYDWSMIAPRLEKIYKQIVFDR